MQVGSVEGVEAIEDMLDGDVTFHLNLRWDLDFELSQVNTVVLNGGWVLEALARNTGQDQFGVTLRGFTRSSNRLAESDLSLREVQAGVLFVDQGEYLILRKQCNIGRHSVVPV
ncbi:hypothetical protein D3C78_1118690 [compost metagenome]